jgi:acyl-CoA-binding protein
MEQFDRLLPIAADEFIPGGEVRLDEYTDKLDLINYFQFLGLIFKGISAYEKSAKLYGLAMQVKYGDVQVDEPSVVAFYDRFLYDAWASQKDKSKWQALDEWLTLVYPTLKEEEVETKHPQEDAAKKNFIECAEKLSSTRTYRKRDELYDAEEAYRERASKYMLKGKGEQMKLIRAERPEQYQVYVIGMLLLDLLILVAVYLFCRKTCSKGERYGGAY